MDRFSAALRVVRCGILQLLLLLLGIYRRAISPGLRPSCRFLPSCSEYAEESLKKYGVMKGLGRTLWRLARCHPLCRGGYDAP